MNYTDGIKHMKDLQGSGRFVAHENITINYPGYKKTGDYRLTVGDKSAPRHRDISKELHDLINSKDYSYIELRALLEDIYTNGTNTVYEDEGLEYLKHLIYWITLQEDINYPRPRYAGINLPFTRFYEAIYSTQNNCGFDIAEVQNRCDNHGRNRPTLYIIDNAPSFYHY